MLSLIRARNNSGQSPQIKPSTKSPSDRVTITAPRHILESSTLHVNFRTRDPVTMPLFPLITLEHNPYGFSHPLDPDYTYVMRRGRGPNRRNYFARAPPRPPPPEPRVVILRRHPRSPPDTYEYCSTINTHDPARRPPSSWHGSPVTCHRCPRPHRPPWHGSFGERSTVSSDGTSTEDFELPRPGHGRHVHWPDGHSDGSLSSDDSTSSSDTSSDSDDGPLASRGRVPRTPSSSPVRGRPYPYPPPTCAACDEMCATDPGPGHGGYNRAGGGGSRWRDAPCRERPVWDRDLGYGVERAPRR